MIYGGLFSMELDLLKKRISVRQYEERPIEREKLEMLVEAARFAPTARNEQPWEFVIVTERSDLERLAKLADYGGFIGNAGACIAVFCRDTKYYLEDGSAATTYLCLAATALGLGSCWVAGDKKIYAEDVRQILRAPEGYRLISLVSLGYPAEDHTKSKRSAEEMIHWEQY